MLTSIISTGDLHIFGVTGTGDLVHGFAQTFGVWRHKAGSGPSRSSELDGAIKRSGNEPE